MDAVVSISEFAESPKPAIKSVLRYPARFKALHIEQYGYSTTAELYPGWKEDLAELTRHNLTPVWHSVLDPTKLVTRALVHISPDLQVKDAALDMLSEDMENNHKWNSHFAVSSITHLDNIKKPSDYLSSLLYGFIVVLAVFDSFRSFFNGFRYHRTADLRAQTVYVTYPSTVELAPTRWWTWLIFTRVGVISKGGSALMQVPSYIDGGASFVLRTIKTHKHLGIGVWIPFFFLYYLFFAWPWWTPFFASYRIPYISRVFGWLLEREPPFYWIIQYFVLGDRTVVFNPVWQVVHVLHLCVVATITYMYIVLPPKLNGVIVLAYPIYLMMLPVLIVYSWFHVSRAGWVIEEDGEHSIKED